MQGSKTKVSQSCPLLQKQDFSMGQMVEETNTKVGERLCSDYGGELIVKAFLGRVRQSALWSMTSRKINWVFVHKMKFSLLKPGWLMSKLVLRTDVILNTQMNQPSKRYFWDFQNWQHFHANIFNTKLLTESFHAALKQFSEGDLDARYHTCS